MWGDVNSRELTQSSSANIYKRITRGPKTVSLKGREEGVTSFRQVLKPDGHAHALRMGEEGERMLEL